MFCIIFCWIKYVLINVGVYGFGVYLIRSVLILVVLEVGLFVKDIMRVVDGFNVLILNKFYRRGIED